MQLYSMLGRESLYKVKKICVGGCAWQKRHHENVIVKFQLQCQEIYSNTLKCIETYYKCIEIYYRHIEINHKYITSTFKYIQIYYEYIQIY
jgi:hypothetical protein